MKALMTIVVVLPLVVVNVDAVAASFGGNYQVSVTETQHNNGNYCLTLTDGGRNRGEASIPGDPYGTFQLIDHTIVVAVEIQGDNGQNSGLVVTAAARNGSIGKGVTALIYGGEMTYVGRAVFGMKGSC